MTRKTTMGTALARAPGQGRPYRHDERARAIEYTSARRNEGAGLNRIAREIGVARGTLKKWIDAGAFEAVEIAEVVPRRYTLLGPCAVRIEDLTLEEIAQLVRRLA
jgi:hypothetical protein